MARNVEITQTTNTNRTMSNTSLQSVTLQIAVLMQVKDFADAQQTFSVHDITRTVREKVNNGLLEIPEVEVSDTSFHFDIPHAKVKALFEELWRTGVFNPDFTLNRHFNNVYFEYTPIPNTQSVPSNATVIAPVSVSTPASSVNTITSTAGVSRTEVTNRIRLYLNNCARRSFRPSLKQIQSAVKRGEISTGWSCDDIKSIVENDLGFTIVSDPSSVAQSQVVL